MGRATVDLGTRQLLTRTSPAALASSSVSVASAFQPSAFLVEQVGGYRVELSLDPPRAWVMPVDFRVGWSLWCWGVSWPPVCPAFPLGFLFVGVCVGGQVAPVVGCVNSAL